MVRNNKSEACCGPGIGIGCCKVESVITIDDRGQMVLPKELRDKAGIRGGDKLAVISWERDGETCCISLIKTDELAQLVKGMLGPMIGELTTKQESSD